MKNKLYEQIRNGEKKPIATHCILCGMSISIFEVENGIETKVITGFIFPNTIANIKKVKVFETANGEKDYFVRYGKRYYLDDFMRV